MNKLINGSALVILLFITANILQAGAWTQGKNKYYFQASYQSLSGDQFYDADGNKISMNKLTDHTISLYGEYGLTDDITIFGYIPFYKDLTIEDTEGGIIPDVKTVGGDRNKGGVSDIDFGAKIKLASYKQSVFSASVLFGIPTGDSDEQGGLVLGDGEFNQAVIFNAGHSLYPLPSYITWGLGYNNRTEGYSDEIFAYLEGGYSFMERKLTLILKVRGLFSVDNGDGLAKGGYGKVFADEQSYIAYGPTINYKLNKNLGINASVTTGAAASNIISALVYRVGISISN